jgi:acetyl esterase
VAARAQVAGRLVTLVEGPSPALELVTQQFVDTLTDGSPMEARSLIDAREILVQLQSRPAGRPRAETEDVRFPVGPTGFVRIRIVRPRDSAAPLPAIMHFHGGGWALGDPATHDRLTREVAVGVGAAVFFVDYDRSPETRFPVALEQAYAATLYVAEHASELRVDATRLAVMGENTGGTIAAAVTMMAKQQRGPKICLQVLLYPVMDANFHTRSYEAFADGPWLTRSAMQRFWDAYLPDLAARRAVMASPLNATLDELRDLPDALVCVAECDVLRDEGEAYARRLSDAGVRVTSVCYNGTIHDFILLNALADTPAARAAIAQAVNALRSVFD